MLKILASTALVSVLATGAFAQEATTTEPESAAPAQAQGGEAVMPEAGEAEAGTVAEEAGDAATGAAEEAGQAVTDTAEEAGEAATDTAQEGADAASDMADDAGDAATGTVGEAPAAGAGTVAGEAPATGDATVAGEGAAVDPMAAREGWGEPGEGFTRVAVDSISADQLIGTDIRNLEDETVAGLSDVILTDDGKVESVVAEFGGFLGFGETTVLLTMDEIDVLQDEAGNLIVRTNLTPEALEGRPEYEADAS